MILIIIEISLLLLSLIVFSRMPRGFLSFSKRKLVEEVEFPDPINRDRYLTKKKPTTKIDTVVIGSGISGKLNLKFN